jgi:hypothetical protein
MAFNIFKPYPAGSLNTDPFTTDLDKELKKSHLTFGSQLHQHSLPLSANELDTPNNQLHAKERKA